MYVVEYYVFKLLICIAYTVVCPEFSTYISKAEVSKMFDF